MSKWVMWVLMVGFFVACQPKSKMEPTVVIGGGLMGSATAWQLARQGEPVLLLERQDSIYTSGSSQGEARISRSLGPKGDIFAYLQIRGLEETQILIDFLNEKDPGKHSMEDIYTTSPVTYIFYPETSDQVAVFNLDEPDTLTESDQDSLVLATTPKEIEQKFQMTVSDSLKVIREYRKYTGTMNPKELIRKLHLAIQYAGGEVRYNQKVARMERDAEGYRLTMTNQAEPILCRKMVAAAGPYNGTLLRDVSSIFEELINPKRLFLAFLKIKPEVYQQWSETEKIKLFDSYPAIKLNDDLFYSMIEKVDSDGIPIIKVGGHFIRTEIESLDDVWSQPILEEELNWSIDETIDYLKMIQLPIEKDDLVHHGSYSCVYSLTESEIPLVTNLLLPDGSLDKSGVLIGGMSGVGAKGTMTYGHLASELLMGKNSPDDKMYEKTKKELGNDRILIAPKN